MATIDDTQKLHNKLAAPLLEEGEEGQAEAPVIPYSARLLRIGAKLFAKACGVAIAWSWADAIHSSFSDHLVPASLTAFTGLLYAVVMTIFTTIMVKYIAEGAGDPDNEEFGKFGEHSRELLLIVQPMMLAWAWKDALREVVWDRLPQDSMVWLVFYRLLFASLISLGMAYIIIELGKAIERHKQAIEEQRAAVADEDADGGDPTVYGLSSTELQTYSVVAMTLLSASFGLFIAWCWNSVAKAAGAAISRKEAATAVTTTVYAAGVTAAAAYITSDLATQMREFATSNSPEGTQPVWLKFIDLVMVSIGYIVGWAWSDAATNVLLETLGFTDARMLYLVYSICVTVAAVVFSHHMARVLESADTSRLGRQYMTLLLNALALMTGWAWKSYIQYFVKEYFVLQGAGRIVTNWFQAFMMTMLACYGYHKLAKEAKKKVSDASEAMIDRAANQMD